MKINNFRDLEIWKSGKEIAREIYKITCAFPKDELFGIVHQMRKSAISIPSNISEGFNRYHSKDYIRFLYISLGSCAELETQIEISSDIGYLPNHTKDDLLGILERESKMINSLIVKIKLKDRVRS